MAEYSLDCSLAWETRAQLDPFTLAYVEAAMWLLTDDDGHSLDYLGLHDVAAETIANVIDECKLWQVQHEALLNRAQAEYGYSRRSAGHDFYLTRNGHGAGFWDRGIGKIGEALTKAAAAEGNDDWYVGDDGQVYRM